MDYLLELGIAFWTQLNGLTNETLTWASRVSEIDTTAHNNVMHAKPGLRAGFSACKIIVPAR